MLENQPKYDVGIIGDGQLAQMLTHAGNEMGIKINTMGPVGNGKSPAEYAGADHITAPIDHFDSTLELASSAEVTTIEIEHVNPHALRIAEAAGAVVRPSAEVVRRVQDKLWQKLFVDSLGIPTAQFFTPRDMQDVVEFLKLTPEHRVVLKKRVGGFDGRGNFEAGNPAEIIRGWDRLGGKDLYAEEFVPVKKEIALQVARSVSGDIASYDVVESVQVGGVCSEVFTSDNLSDQIRSDARNYAEKIIKELGGIGVFGFEMFVTEDDKVVFNEMAPRVHNSGHHTIDSAKTSQFAQHLLAVTGDALEEPGLVVPHAAMANILYTPDPKGIEYAKGANGISVHMYDGKEARPDGSPRKIGHVTAVDRDPQRALANARRARQLIYGVIPH